MIFNLNEQKVLSDPSGSSVFKGEKDFNNIVVNLPDNIDGHTATELNYVMHFVDSDGGYSTKILTVDSSGKTLKATATVSTSITSKAQAFYAYVLMTDDEETVIGKTNGVIVMIHPVPDEENEIYPPSDADKIIKGLEEIVQEATETIETATDTIEEATEAISSKQDKLTAGENITISDDNVISAEGGGVTSYNDLTDKPALNNSEILGDYVSDRIYVQDEDGVKSIRFHNIMLDDFYLSDKNKIMTIVYNNSEYNLNKILEAARIISIENGSVWRYSNLPINKGGCLFCLNQCTQVYLVLRENLSDKTQIFIRQKTDYVSNWSEWENLTDGGSQIVSGVVNANGTITFTDSDGNTFTTTGSNLVTSGNEQISVGYDNGGFYFLFDDGQGA